MKKILLSIITVAMLFSMIGCDPEIKPVISLDVTEVTLNMESTLTLTASITPADTELYLLWKSSNKAVATVDNNGVVTALTVGTATITAFSPGAEEATCVVTVRDHSIILPSSITLLKYDTCVLKADLPAWDSNAQLTWATSNNLVATVDANGKVEAIAPGETTITASAEGLKTAICVVKVEDIPSSFPRKYLIEHFTGDGCGYCPYGMYSIVEYRNYLTTTPCIWVSHHYGYNNDEYTISESSKIGSACGVQGAPNMAMNRTKVQGTSIAFHPGYLVEDGMAETIANKCDTVAEASIVIDHTYDAATRELNVTVKGLVGNPDTKEYLLTVLIKENGLIGKQADYYWSWKTAGYKEFMHPCVARDVLNASPYGDTVKVENQAYSKTLTYTIPEKWVAENCNVVAYITPLSKKPVINAEETPLVAGTTGGTEYQPFGITENQAPTNASKLTFDALELNKVANDKLAIELLASNSTRSDFYGPMKLAVYLEFNTNEDVLPVDTLDFADGNELNTFSTGIVDLKEQTWNGSRMAYYLAADMEQLCHIWRIKSGKLLVYPDGSFYTSGKLDNGKNFAITCTLPEPAAAPKKVVFNQEHVEKLSRIGRFVIKIDEIEYNL